MGCRQGHIHLPPAATLQLASLYTAQNSLSSLSAPVPQTSLLNTSDQRGSGDLSINMSLYHRKGHQSIVPPSEYRADKLLQLLGKEVCHTIHE